MLQRRSYWVRDKETKKLEHISKVTASNRGDWVCAVCGAAIGSEVVYGDEGYFLCSCDGSVNFKSLLHDFVELALTDEVSCDGGIEFFVPSSSYKKDRIFHFPVLDAEGFVRLSGVDRGIHVKDGEDTVDFVLHTDKGDIYLNLLIDTKLRHKSYDYLSRVSKDYRVVNLYLSSYDMRGFSGSKSLVWFSGFRALILTGVKNKEVVSSYKLSICRRRSVEGEFSCSGEEILCPARDYREVVTKETCRDCPLCIGVGKKVTCYGRGVYATRHQILGNFTREERLDMISLPDSEGEVELGSRGEAVYPEGLCIRCGRPTIFSQSGNGIPIVGVHRSSIADVADRVFYKFCGSCGYYERILCPVCKSPMQLHSNRRSRKVFAICTVCSCSITLFESQPCKGYADELLEVGSIDSFLNDYDHAREELSELRGRMKMRGRGRF